MTDNENDNTPQNSDKEIPPEFQKELSPIEAAKIRKAQRATQRKMPEQCRVCGQWAPTIDAQHAKQHGLTLEQYNNMGRSKVRAGAEHLAEQVNDPLQMAESLSNIAKEQQLGKAQPKNFLDPIKTALQIFKDKFAIRDLATEAAAAMMSGPQRQQISLAVTALIQKRLIMHAGASALMDQVRAELAQPWRTTQGGEGGKPTDTKDLVGMAHFALAEMRQGEELLIKAARLALEEQRVNPMAAFVHRGPTFSGEATSIPVPPDMTPAERETVRLLHAAIVQKAQAYHAEGPAVPVEPDRDRFEDHDDSAKDAPQNHNSP